jgi:hypothetical protein
MVDLPGRTAYDRAGPNDEEEGWGSPVPAEYGSLRAVPPRVEEGPSKAYNASSEAVSDRSAVVTLLRRLQGEGAAAVVAPATSLLRRLQGDGPGALAAPPGAVPETEGAPLPNGLVEPSAPVVGPITVPDDVSLVSDLVVASTRTRRRPVRRTVPPRSRATVRHIEILTVLRVSVIFWLVMLMAVVVASWMLWIFADAFGSLPSIEKSIRTLFSLKSFKLHPGQVAFYTFLGGLVVSIAGIFANVLFALIYNLIADVVGGVRVELDHTSGD